MFYYFIIKKLWLRRNRETHWLFVYRFVINLLNLLMFSDSIMFYVLRFVKVGKVNLLSFSQLLREGRDYIDEDIDGKYHCIWLKLHLTS